MSLQQVFLYRLASGERLDEHFVREHFVREHSVHFIHVQFNLFAMI